ncbi:MAG: hypothetical protein U1F83_13245 [Verrucomicrobiota bacterium]
MSASAPHLSSKAWPLLARQSAKCLIALLLILAVEGCGDSAKAPPNLAKMRGLSAATPEEPWDSKLEKFAEQAVIDAWKRHHIALDFSTNSVQSLEQILDRMNRSPQFQPFSEKDKRAEAMIAGAYIGEVIRRNHNGVWGVHSDAAGEYSFPVSFGPRQAFPIMWCLKRLVNGREDNVWHKYLYFVVEQTNNIPIAPTYYSNRDEWLKVEGAMTNFIK